MALKNIVATPTASNLNTVKYAGFVASRALEHVLYLAEIFIFSFHLMHALTAELAILLVEQWVKPRPGGSYLMGRCITGKAFIWTKPQGWSQRQAIPSASLVELSHSLCDKYQCTTSSRNTSTVTEEEEKTLSSLPKRGEQDCSCTMQSPTCADKQPCKVERNTRSTSACTAFFSFSF